MDLKKNSNADSDDMFSRSGYVLMGLVLIIASVFCLIEYNKIDAAGASIDSKLSELQDEEVIEVNPDSPPPPPPPPPPPAPPEEIEVLEEEDEREETKNVFTEQEETQNLIVDMPEEEDEADLDEVWDFPEENPEFKGGMQKMYEYLRDNIQYPEMAKENGIQGKVFVQFVVGKDGAIREIKILKGIHKTLDKEAIRVVKSMPKWNPGKQLGIPVSVRFTLPIKFKIS